jgi:hypothetical protein
MSKEDVSLVEKMLHERVKQRVEIQVKAQRQEIWKAFTSANITPEYYNFDLHGVSVNLGFVLKAALDAHQERLIAHGLKNAITRLLDEATVTRLTEDNPA